MEEFIKFLGVCVLVFGGLFIVVFLIVGVLNKIEVNGDISMIEQLRNDVKKSGCVNNEDIIGQVTDWNQRIAQYRRYNKMFLISWIIPDEWDCVDFIEVK